MRRIRTSNSYVEFIEASNDGNILSTRGFQFGELYFQIKNNKVTFYLNDQENPWRNDVWTINIPFELDGVVYDNEDDASAALHHIMNDTFQEQLDALNEELAGEEARAQAAEEALGEEIDDERDRATSAETHLQTEVTELSGTVATFDERITRVEDDMSAFTDNLTNEIARSTGKDAEHDAQISGLTNTLNSEIQRALSAETTLHNDITSERDRAIAAESVLTNNLNAEILRSTGKDSEHNTAISGLTSDLSTEISNRTNADNALQNNLTNEVNRAVSADTELHNEIVAERNRAIAAESGITDNLNAEISARTTADTALAQRVTALEVGKADANSVYTKTESDNKYATKDYLSGLTENIYTKGEVNTLLNDKADKVSAVSSAIYNSQSKTIDFKNISGTVISSIDARDFIKDGMVDTVAISGSNLVITFNTDAGKEPISIALTDIFNPANYYNKTDIDNIVSGINESVDTISGNVATISGNVDSISGDVQTLSGNIQNIGDSAVTDIRILTYSQGNSLQIEQKKANAWSYVNTIYKIGSGLTWDYTTKTIATDADTVALKSDIQTLSGEIQTISGNSISSGDVQSMIDESISGKADTSAVTASLLEKVNVVDNEVPDYYVSGTNEYSRYFPSQSEHATYANGIDEVKVGSWYSDVFYKDWNWTLVIDFEVIDENGNTETGRTYIEEDYNPNSTNLKPSGLDDYIVTDWVPSGTNAGDLTYTTVDGWKISYINAYEDNGDGMIVGLKLYSSTSTKLYNGGQSENVIENVIEPELVRLSNAVNAIPTYSAGTNVQINNGVISATDTKYTAGTGIDITNNVISVTGGTEGITSAQCQTLIDESISGKTIDSLSAGTNVTISNNVISATDTTYSAGSGITISNNIISTVTKFWCGTEQEWGQISGGTLDSNTIYMVH